MMKKINKQKNSKKSNKGITLIALVVTIIVLLLLAGISISMLSGENGVLSRATQAKEETVAGEVQEERDLWNLAKTTDDYSNTNIAESLDELLERLGPNNKKLLTAEQVEEIKTTGQVTIGSRTIVFELKIGNVIEAEGLKKFKDENENEIDWIYFGKDDNGNNLITTAKPINDKFTWNKQPEGVTDNEKIENSAKNWLYYDLQEGQDGYDDIDCTIENNINKFCANLYLKLYSNGENIVGKARSITLEDINRVIGFVAPTFNKYEFGVTDNNFNATNSNGNYIVNYFYPTLEAKTANSDTTYQYWKKAKVVFEQIVDAKNNIPCDAYYYYKNGDNYSFYWEGTTRSWSDEPLSSTSSWKLETPENMKYVTGENSELEYVVGSCSVGVGSSNAGFYVTGVGSGYVGSDRNYYCGSNAEDAYSGSSNSFLVRPVVSLTSGVQLKIVQ